MSQNFPLNEPSVVSAECGEILLDGPNGLAAAFTIDAAEETARRLLRAVHEARGINGPAPSDPPG